MEMRIGRWTLVRTLGSGAMGTVHEARLDSGPERFALKLLEDASPEHSARFIREQRLLEFLGRHPNIVRFRDAGEERGRPFLVMDLLSGGTLAERLKKEQISREAACAALVLVARALHFAHEAGVVHRDVKPSNILFDGAGKPFVADFGIAKVLLDSGKLTASGTTIGTAAYMAPEQVDTSLGAVDRRSDVYALGAVLYEVLAGRPPFEGPQVTLFKSALLDAPKPPSTIAKGIDPALEAVCLRALAKRAADRPQTAEEFARELEAVGGRRARAFPRMLVAVLLGAVLVAAAVLLHERRLGFELAHARQELDESRREFTESTRELTERDLGSSTEPSPERWERLARTLEASRKAESAARAFLVASDRWTASGDADRLERAASSVERAFELELAAVVAARAPATAPLEESSRKTLALADGGGPTAIRVARRRLIRFRLLRPDDEVPRKTLSRLHELGEAPDPEIRAAARPWTGFVREVRPLEELMAQSPVSPGTVHFDDPATWPAGWRERLDYCREERSRQASFELEGEALLWHPELAFLWTYLAGTAATVGRAPEALRAYEVALSKDDSYRAPWWFAAALRDLGRPREALPHIRLAFEKAGSRDVTPVDRMWMHFELMVCLVEIGGREEAREAEEEVKKIQQLNPSFRHQTFEKCRARIREILDK
jgi:serine/threonine protein kinase